MVFFIIVFFKNNFDVVFFFSFGRLNIVILSVFKVFCKHFFHGTNFVYLDSVVDYILDLLFDYI